MLWIWDIIKDDFELLRLYTLPPKYWDFRHVPAYLYDLYVAEGVIQGFMNAKTNTKTNKTIFPALPFWLLRHDLTSYHRLASNLQQSSRVLGLQAWGIPHCSHCNFFSHSLGVELYAPAVGSPFSHNVSHLVRSAESRRIWSEMAYHMATLRSTLGEQGSNPDPKHQCSSSKLYLLSNSLYPKLNS